MIVMRAAEEQREGLSRRSKALGGADWKERTSSAANNLQGTYVRALPSDRAVFEIVGLAM